MKEDPPMKITFYGTRDYDHLYFEVLAADPEYGVQHQLSDSQSG